MKLLIASGSFKDVFTSGEACSMLSEILPASGGITSDICPVCDGGEYTLSTLLSFFTNDKKNKLSTEKEQPGSGPSLRQNEVITVENVINPYGKPVSVQYLAHNNAAYIVSSEILHLNLDEDEYKNPLRLTDYGLGQLIADAISKGYKDIRLCLGGTSTVGYGMGTIQALGAEFYDESGSTITEPVTPADYLRVSRINFKTEKYPGIRLSVINDGVTRASDLDVVTPLKIGESFACQKAEILSAVDAACDKVYELTGLTPDDAWSGNGGGIYFGVEKMFNAEYYKGADYFCDLFGLDEKIAAVDAVITGEGRFDNPHLKKIPIVVAERAKKYNKPVIFTCGQIAPEWKAACSCLGDGIYSSEELKNNYGIDLILSCTEYYEKYSIETSKSVFAKYTPIILKERLDRVFDSGLLEN